MTPRVFYYTYDYKYMTRAFIISLFVSMSHVLYFLLHQHRRTTRTFRCVSSVFFLIAAWKIIEPTTTSKDTNATQRERKSLRVVLTGWLDDAICFQNDTATISNPHQLYDCFSFDIQHTSKKDTLLLDLCCIFD